MNREALEQLINDKGIKKNFISKSLDITDQALYNKLNGKSDFTRGEVEILCDVLDITNPEDVMSIFFTQQVEQ